MDVVRDEDLGPDGCLLKGYHGIYAACSQRGFVEPRFSQQVTAQSPVRYQSQRSDLLSAWAAWDVNLGAER
jgi:hypothetical protein